MLHRNWRKTCEEYSLGRNKWTELPVLSNALAWSAGLLLPFCLSRVRSETHFIWEHFNGKTRLQCSQDQLVNKTRTCPSFLRKQSLSEISLRSSPSEDDVPRYTYNRRGKDLHSRSTEIRRKLEADSEHFWREEVELDFKMNILIILKLLHLGRKSFTLDRILSESQN